MALPTKRIQCFDHQADNSLSAPWVIFFHGFGADAHDLEGLKDYFTFTSAVNLRFPNGVYEVPIGPGWTGRAWWPLTLNALPGDWSQIKPEPLNDLREALFNMIHQLQIPWNKIILGGFSQGAMLATDLFLNAPEAPLGLISMSGSLINKTEWEPLIKQRQQGSIFLSHGEQDQVLPVGGSQKLMQLFKQNQFNCKWVPFQGGHEIPMKVIDGINQYVHDLIKK